MDIAGHLLVKGHSIRFHSHALSEPVQPIPPILEHLILEGRLEEQVVIVILGEG